MLQDTNLTPKILAILYFQIINPQIGSRQNSIDCQKFLTSFLDAVFENLKIPKTSETDLDESFESYESILPIKEDNFRDNVGYLIEILEGIEVESEQENLMNLNKNDNLKKLKVAYGMTLVN